MFKIYLRKLLSLKRKQKMLSLKISSKINFNRWMAVVQDFNPNTLGRGRQSSVSLRSPWSTEWVSELQRNPILKSQKNELVTTLIILTKIEIYDKL